MNRDQFYKKIDSFNDELINIRRHIHAHPELSGLENQTAILISGFLKNIGWNVKESIGRTGVIADFGPLDKGIIGLRVDMDALPIFEETKLNFLILFQIHQYFLTGNLLKQYLTLPWQIQDYLKQLLKINLLLVPIVMWILQH